MEPSGTVATTNLKMAIGIFFFNTNQIYNISGIYNMLIINSISLALEFTFLLIETLAFTLIIIGTNS